MNLLLSRLLPAVAAALLLLSLTACTQQSVDSVVADALALAANDTRDDWRAAAERLETVVRRGVEDPNVIGLYVLALARSGERGQALEVGEPFALAHQDEFLVHYIVGKLHVEADDPEAAVAYLRTACSLRPDHLDAKALYASCAGRLNLPEAGELYESLLALPTAEQSAEQDALAYNELGVWYVHQGQPRLAMSNFSKALDRSGKNPLIYLNMAVTADYHLKQPESARPYYYNFLAASNEAFPRKEDQVRARLRGIAGLQ
jgi:Flp pilus assembly protein TadD